MDENWSGNNDDGADIQSGSVLLIRLQTLVLVTAGAILLMIKLERRLSGYDQVKAKLSLQERKAYDDVLYMDYMSGEEPDYEDQEDPITGESIKRLVGYATRKLPWERSRLTSLKSKLDKVHAQNLTSHARQMLKPRRVGGVSSRPSPEVFYDYQKLLANLHTGRSVFGNKVGQGQFRGKSFPTYVYPRGLKNVVREILDANFKYYPDSEGAAVYNVTIQDLFTAKWPAVH
ncbi:hypothetical protein P5673_026821 [Acropora cervicornis]|uniref:Uncharacterized protein n=1 Tax=Acropora cervicornis TaxID=6130 RepID=A0AAD9UW25_ACRCE|nr:hypothetical protein P5673_026821 [Acropora cervicornis]